MIALTFCLSRVYAIHITTCSTPTDSPMCRTSGNRIPPSLSRMLPCSYPSAPAFYRAPPSRVLFCPASWVGVRVLRWTHTGSTRTLATLVVRSTASRLARSVSRDSATMPRSSKRSSPWNRTLRFRRARGTSTASSCLSFSTHNSRVCPGSSSMHSRITWESRRSSLWTS